METLTPNIPSQKHLFSSLETTLFGPSPLIRWQRPGQSALRPWHIEMLGLPSSLSSSQESRPFLVGASSPRPSGPCAFSGVLYYDVRKSPVPQIVARICCSFKVWNYSRTKSLELLAICLSICPSLHIFRGGLLIRFFTYLFCLYLLTLSWVNFNL